jgi:hypothetical protein
MDYEWAASQLERFIKKIDLHDFLRNSDIEWDRRHEVAEDNHTSASALVDELITLDPVMRDIMNAAKPGLGDYPEFGNAATASFKSYWTNLPKSAALKATGIFKLGNEAKERLRVDAPDLHADRLHPWVWGAAVALWQAGSHQEAVQSAARSINARLQQKLGRRDAADAALCREAFSRNPPEPGRPRLRFPGDRTSDTWKSRLQGALDFGAGCFEGIRNPASHEFKLDLPEQVALEQLTALSLFARWIDECDVETVEIED